MLLLRRALACLALLVLATQASAGVSSRTFLTRVGSVAPPLRLRIAITGDPQNYVRIIRGSDFGIPQSQADQWNAAAESVFRSLVDDIIRYAPDFVIVPGDLACDNGGFDQNANARIADDPNTLLEWTNNQLIAYRTRAYDRFLAEGIPVFHVYGNHDSCDDLERIFPAAEWLAYSWGYDVESRPGLCGLAGTTDTTHRAGIFPSPIGNVCVLGIPFNSSDWADGDNGWMETTVGCGAGLPTILVSHSPGQASWDATFEARNQVIGLVNGHALCGDAVLCSTQTPMTAGGGTYNSLALFVNTQGQPPGAMFTGFAGTGGSWWSSWVIDPATNTSELVSHGPAYGGLNQPPPGSGYAMQNSTLPLGIDFCATYPSSPACPP